MTNRLFAFEGVDGCGKSTQIELLHKRLEKEGYEVVRIREPGGTFFSEEVRELLLKKRDVNLDPMAELLLFNAARAQLIKEVVEPAIKSGKIILADRFYLSTLAYQGYGRQMDTGFIEALLKEVCKEYLPTRTFLLDLSAEDSEKRRALRDESPDRMELEKMAFFERVVTGYRKAALNDSLKISRYKATENIDIIHHQIAKEVFELLRNN